MRYGVTFPDLHPRDFAELAYEAEAAGWDGVFVWDCIWGIDPWVSLAGAAMRTERVRLGTMLTPVSRRKPWELASEATTLDHLSNGRLVLPVGLGAPETGFDKVGEETDRKRRAEMLDEGLDVLEGFWSGQPFTYHGQHYQVDDVTFVPKPVQSPRIPLWVVGAWPRMKSMRRVLRCDGVLPVKLQDNGSFANMTPEDLVVLNGFLAEQRPGAQFEIIMEGETPGDDVQQARSQLAPLAEAGLTWWLENVWDTPRERGGIEGMCARVRQGPPR